VSILKEYVEHVVAELARDEKFIQQLRTVKSRKYASVSDIEQFVNEWLASQKGLSKNDARLAHRIATAKFAELLHRSHNDVGDAKRELFSLLTSQIIRKKAVHR
jgi:demethoxyubiquinone hydroxylase (CLK1/Coq7/Cat5 family)